MTGLAAVLGSLQGPVLLLVAGLLLIPESGLAIGFFLPGTTLLFALGFCAHAGLVPFAAALPVAAAGAVLGPQVGYFRGRRRKDAPSWLLDRLPASIPRKVEAYLLRHPVLSVACGQWLVSARMVTPWLAGRALPWRRFTLANVPSAALWAVSLTTLGYVAGVQVTQLLNTGMTVVGVGAVLVVAGFALVRMMIARTRAQPRYV
jgi:membrane protein DedA with SNARE-associated domain